MPQVLTDTYACKWLSIPKQNARNSLYNCRKGQWYLSRTLFSPHKLHRRIRCLQMPCVGSLSKILSSCPWAPVRPCHYPFVCLRFRAWMAFTQMAAISLSEDSARAPRQSPAMERGCSSRGGLWGHCCCPRGKGSTSSSVPWPSQTRMGA